MKILRIPGQAALILLQQLGRLALFTGQAVFWAMRPPYYGRQMFRQIIDIGYYSLPVVGLTT